jgi:hypothetical protein
MLVPAVLKVTVQGMGWNLRERNSRAAVQTAPMSATESRYDENEISCCEGSSRSESNCHSKAIEMKNLSARRSDSADKPLQPTEDPSSKITSEEQKQSAMSSLN